jgi:hypothetical protein
MYKNLKATTVAIALGVAGALSTGSALAAFGISFNVGDVDVAYSDGYWDHHHHWHAWHRGEADWYRSHYRSNWHEWRHDDRHHDHEHDRDRDHHY